MGADGRQGGALHNLTRALSLIPTRTVAPALALTLALTLVLALALALSLSQSLALNVILALTLALTLSLSRTRRRPAQRGYSARVQLTRAARRSAAAATRLLARSSTNTGWG